MFKSATLSSLPSRPVINPPAFKTNPKRYIPIFSRSMDLSDEATQDALILADRILKIKPSLIESNSQNCGCPEFYDTI